MTRLLLRDLILKQKFDFKFYKKIVKTFYTNYACSIMYVQLTIQRSTIANSIEIKIINQSKGKLIV